MEGQFWRKGLFGWGSWYSWKGVIDQLFSVLNSSISVVTIFEFHCSFVGQILTSFLLAADLILENVPQGKASVECYNPSREPRWKGPDSAEVHHHPPSGWLCLQKGYQRPWLLPCCDLSWAHRWRQGEAELRWCPLPCGFQWGHLQALPGRNSGGSRAQGAEARGILEVWTRGEHIPLAPQDARLQICSRGEPTFHEWQAVEDREGCRGSLHCDRDKVAGGGERVSGTGELGGRFPRSSFLSFELMHQRCACHLTSNGSGQDLGMIPLEVYCVWLPFCLYKLSWAFHTNNVYCRWDERE